MFTPRFTAACLALALLASPALAARKKNTPANNTPAPAPSYLPSSTSGGSGAITPMDSTAADGQAIKANIDSATADVKQAQTDLNTYAAARKSDFEKTDAIAALLQAVADDKAKLETIESPLRATLTSTDSRYAGAIKDLPDTQNKLDAAKTAKNADEIFYQKSEVDRLTGIITAAETTAYAKSPDYAPAKAKLDADSAKLATAEAAFPDYLAASPDYSALTLALANAKAHLATLQGTVASN